MINTPRFEYTTVVLHVEKKNITLTSKDILQGLTEESARILSELGEKGWELVSVVSYSIGISYAESLLAFLKRTKA